VNTPKVFVSHASEDKDRFVLDFAAKLRAKGIDAWVDKWEMLAGDKLIDKIFEEGIKNARAMIVVLSKYSVNKPWVREELNAGMVKRIEDNAKLIPVIIDDCEIPECLRATVWVKIKNLNNYDAELESIVLSIFGKLDRPPMGNPPAYAQTVIDVVPGLTELDSLILKLACEMALEIDYPFIETGPLYVRAQPHELHQRDFFESLDILEHKGYIKLVRPMSVDPPAFTITLYGFEQYAKVYVPDYSSIVHMIATQIVNNEGENEDSISEQLDQPLMLIRHILKALANRRLIKIFEGNGGFIMITNVSPELKRALNQR
jgi:hypothetical protein